MAERVLVVASPAYAVRAEDRAPAGVGLGVRWETKYLREIVYRDDAAALQKVVPVVLPGGRREDLPDWVHPTTNTVYTVTEFTVAGAERLLRLLTRQPAEVEPPLGTVPVLAPRAAPAPVLDASSAAGSAASEVRSAVARPTLHTRVVVELIGRSDGQVHIRVSVAGAELGERTGRLPRSVTEAWEALAAGPLAAGARLAAAGRELAQVLFDPGTAARLGELVDILPPGDRVEVEVAVDESTLDVPVELLRLSDAAGSDLGPLVLRPGVSVRRRAVFAVGTPVAPSAGPVRVLAAVAAPEETRTPNPPLDVEAEMQALLDAVAPVAKQPGAAMQVLEVAGLPQITEAAQRGGPFHVLHLSAHGSADGVELEDEDGNPLSVTATQLVDALRRADMVVPLVMLSSCRGATGGQSGLAGELLRRGVDRVIAMQAPVTDSYATDLARALYAGLARDPGCPVGFALGDARISVEQARQSEAHRAVQRRGAPAQRDTRAGAVAPPAVLPEFGVPVLLAAGEDLPLVDLTLDSVSLPSATLPPSGRGVLELPVGRLIGRRRELRTALPVLRRTVRAVEEYGATAGVVLTGPGGIGKTALAGRVIARLRADGWAVVVHAGAWNPNALLAAAADGLDAAGLRPEAAARLRDGRVDAADRLPELAGLLGDTRLLLVFDDFEQNLTDGGQAFRDPAVDELFTELCDAAQAGAMLVTCWYPLPDDDRWLFRVEVPPLSTAELRRLLLRLPALRDLPGEDRLAVVRTIGGHPRLIEFVDALLRARPPALRETAVKMRGLAGQAGRTSPPMVGSPRLVGAGAEGGGGGAGAKECAGRDGPEGLQDLRDVGAQ